MENNILYQRQMDKKRPGISAFSLRPFYFFFGGVMLLALAALSSAGAVGMKAGNAASLSASMVATQAADPDLCALLRRTLPGEGAGWTFSSSNPTQECDVVNTGDGLPASTKELTITKYSSPEAARAQLKSMYTAATANNFGRWDATTFFGDPGHGYLIIPINLNDPGGVFARGCYVVKATSLRGPPPVEPTQDLLIRVDAGLKAAPCGGGTPDRAPVDALRIIVPGESAPCPLRSPETYKLRIYSGPVRGGTEIGKVPIFLKSSDGKKVGAFPAEGATAYRYLSNDNPNEFLFLNSGWELTLPSELPKNNKDRWKITIELGPGEIYEVGPTGSIKIPCNPADPVKIISGTADALIETSLASPIHKIETDNAVINPISKGALFNALSLNTQTPNYGIRISIDARDPAKTGVTVYAGTVQASPKSGGTGVTLTAGQRVDVTKANVSQPTNVVSVPGIDSYTFPETAKAATGIFMDYWLTHGGLAQQGYPVSGLIREKSDLNGQTYTVQYFERAVFEFHSEYSVPNDVLLSQLGTFQYKRKYPQGAPNQKPNTSAGSRLFTETGKRVGGKFLDYWNTHGGLAQQGFPLSEEFTEVSETDGKTYLVQYFERAVFEFHPEFAPPNDVLLSLLGNFFYKQKYGGGQPPLPPGGGATPTTTSGGNCSATTNIAAASNGGTIAGASSDFGLGWKPERIIDGDLNTGWASDNGSNTNQYVIVALPKGQTYNVNKVRINPWNTAPSCCPDDATKDFEIRVSTTDANPNSFTTVFRGTTPKENAFFEYTLSAVQAKYVMLFVVNNYGGRWIEVKEFEVYQTCTGGGGNPTSVPAATPTPVAGGQCAGIPANQNMTVTPSNCARAGTDFVFEAAGFNPGESVQVAVTAPDGRVYSASGQLIADQNGAIRIPNAVTLETEPTSLPGQYTIVMEGLTSRRQAIGYIRLLAP